MDASIEPRVFSEAVWIFWNTRSVQGDAQQARGNVDQGTRSLVTGGNQMAGFVTKIVELMIGVGVQPSDIFT